MAVRHWFVDANGLRLHGVDFGGDGPPTLLLHGVTSHWASWLPLAERIGSERRLIALDFRGHGDSQWAGDGAYATGDLASDTTSVLEALADVSARAPFDIVGASWGGLCGLLVAGARPDLVGSLVVVDVPPSWDLAPDDVAPRPESFANQAEVIAFERPRYRFASDAAIETLATFGTRAGPGGRLYFKFDPLFRTRWGFRAEDHWADLASVQSSTLVVRAGAGGALAPDVAQRMVAALSRGSFAEVAGAGHSVQVDSPDGLAGTLQAFWRDRH
jgi:pimeloyl-ACP methyl ester carboxylesterase